jgi:azurin
MMMILKLKKARNDFITATLRRSAGLALAVGIAACTSEPATQKSSDEEPKPKAAATQPAAGASEAAGQAAAGEPAKAEATAGAADSEEVTVEIEVGDGLKYSKERIEVPAGATVKLTIRHTGKLPKSAMGHNFVLLAQGTEKAAFANAAIGAADNGYIPPNMEDAVLAHTELVGGGESDTIEFEAPAKGEYDYICTFPGHYTQMQGKLIVN